MTDGATPGGTDDAATAGADGESPAGPNDDGYGGLLSAFPYAVRRSDSLAFRLYALTSAVLGALVVVLLALALVVWFANPTGLFGERGLLGVIAIFLLGPLFAPVLLVARRHRRAGGDPRYDRALALAGFAFVVSLWAGLVVSAPAEFRSEPSGLLAPVAAALYALPRSAAFLPPVAGAALVAVAHRLFR